jgi:hypothetical protein
MCGVCDQAPPGPWATTRRVCLPAQQRAEIRGNRQWLIGSRAGGGAGGGRLRLAALSRWQGPPPPPTPPRGEGSWVNLDLGCGLAALSPLLPHQEVTALLRPPEPTTGSWSNRSSRAWRARRTRCGSCCRASVRFFVVEGVYIQQGARAPQSTTPEGRGGGRGGGGGG